MSFNKKLVISGCGIKAISHFSREFEASIKHADIVLSLVNEPIVKEWIDKNSKKHVLLNDIYFDDEDRGVIYKNISDRIVSYLEQYDYVCTAFYGHPTVYCAPGLAAIAKLDKIGVDTEILPGISAQDSMFADLRVDPGEGGCFSVDATDLVKYERIFDTRSNVIVWQISMLGNKGVKQKCNQKSLFVLQSYLERFYSKKQSVYLYEASIYPNMKSHIRKLTLAELGSSQVSTITSLYIPPIK